MEKKHNEVVNPYIRTYLQHLIVEYRFSINKKGYEPKLLKTNDERSRPSYLFFLDLTAYKCWISLDHSVRVYHMTSGQAGNSNDGAVAAEGGPAGAVWFTPAVTPGFTWRKYARVPLSLRLLRLCLHQSFFWIHAIFTFKFLQHVFYLNLYLAVTHTSEGWRGSMHQKDPGCLFRSWESLLKTSPGILSAWNDAEGERWSVSRGKLSWACTECLLYLPDSNLWNCKL